MNLRYLTKTSFKGVLANKLRTFLTMLGIIIGVASVISMVAIGNGARVAVNQAFRFLGSDQIAISPDFRTSDGESDDQGKVLSYEDGLAIPAAIPLVNRVDMSAVNSAKIRHDRNMIDLNVQGVTVDSIDYLTTTNEVQPVDWTGGETITGKDLIGEGRFFTPAETLASENVCVLGYQTALDLFDGDAAVGETIWINHKPFLVIGVLVELETVDPSERYRSKPNEGILVPISSAIHTLFDTEPSVNITAHVSDESQIDTAKEQIMTFLRQRHNISPNEEGNYEDDFYLITQKDVLGAQQESVRVFSLLLATMASISLVVGGIGIMNVMLISVSERTHEIGIRMAIGANRRDVIAQFLVESILISLGGGGIGVMLGIVVIPAVASLNNGNALLDPSSIPLAFGVSLATGVLFGLYPAIKASRLSPIEALRYE